MQKITTTQELTKTTISKLTHFPLLFSLLPRVSTTLYSVLFTWLCNVSPTHVIKVLCRLWFNTVLICRVCQPESTSKHKRNKPPRKRKERWVKGPHSLGAGRQRGAGATDFQEWEGVQQGTCLPGEVDTEARRLAAVGSALEGRVCGGQE